MTTAPSTPAFRVARITVQPHARPGEGPPFDRLGPIDLENPPGAIEGWSVLVRGAAVFFVSPPGWRQGASPQQLPGKGRVRIIEVPRQFVTFVIDAEDATCVDKLARFDIPPIRRPAAPADEQPVLDSKEMGDP